MEKKVKLVAYLFYMVLMAVIFQSCSTPTLEDQVKTYELAHNHHDIEKVMTLYADDITFEIVGAWMRTGKEQVRGLTEWDSVTNSHMIISNIEVNEDTVTFNLKEANDWFRLAGIELMFYEPCRMVFSDGLIKELKAETTRESIVAFQEAWPPVYQWIAEARSEELSRLMFQGEFIYNAENAEKWISLLKEYNQVSK